MARLATVLGGFLLTAVLLQFQGLPQEDLFSEGIYCMAATFTASACRADRRGHSGAAGASYQILFGNSLASPSTVGTMGGAMFGVALYATGLVTFMPPVLLALLGGSVYLCS